MNSKRLFFLVAAMALSIAVCNIVQPLAGTIALSFVGGMGFIYIRFGEE